MNKPGFAQLSKAHIMLIMTKKGPPFPFRKHAEGYIPSTKRSSHPQRHTAQTRDTSLTLAGIEFKRLRRDKAIFLTQWLWPPRPHPPPPSLQSLLSSTPFTPSLQRANMSELERPPGRPAFAPNSARRARCSTRSSETLTSLLAKSLLEL
jgi:hypothetical protein